MTMIKYTLLSKSICTAYPKNDAIFISENVYSMWYDRWNVFVIENTAWYLVHSFAQFVGVVCVFVSDIYSSWWLYPFMQYTKDPRDSNVFVYWSKKKRMKCDHMPSRLPLFFDIFISLRVLMSGLLQYLYSLFSFWHPISNKCQDKIW